MQINVPCVWCEWHLQALANGVCVYMMYSKNHKFYKLLCFLSNLLFQFSEYVRQLWAYINVLEIRCACILKQFVHVTLKTNKVTCFLFHIYVFHHTILNLLIISKINLWWSFLPVFSCPNPNASNLWCWSK